MTIEFDDLIPSNKPSIEFDDLVPQGKRPGWMDNADHLMVETAGGPAPRKTGSVLEGLPAYPQSFNFRAASIARRMLDDQAERQQQYGTIGPIVGPKPTIASVASGLVSDLVSGGKAARAGINQMAGDISGSQYLLDKAKRETAQADLMRAVNTPEFESDTARGIYGGLSSTVRQLPAIAAAVATRNPNIALGGMVAPMVPEEYGKFRQRGADPLAALAGATGSAATEYITEKLPMGFLVRQFGRAGAGQFLTGMLAREVPGEQVATLVQDAIDTAVANPDKTWGDYLAERPGAAYQTLLATITQTGIMGGANAAANRLSGQRQAPEPTLEDYQEAARRVFGRSTPPTRPPVQPAPPAPPVPPAVDRILQAIEQTQNVQNVPPTVPAEIQAAPVEAPAPARADAAAAPGVPAEAPANVEAAGLTFDDLVQAVTPETGNAAPAAPAPSEAAITPETGKQPILQNRNRATPSSIAQMQSIAANPDYGRLGFSRDFANGAPVVAGGQVAPEQLGRQDVAVASDGRRIPVQYAVVEAADVLPSNRADGTPNVDYGDQAVQRIRAIAGNGRIAGLQQAYSKGTTAGYTNELASDTLHGVSPDVIRRMRAPVLVRVMPADQVTADIGDVSNTVGNLNLSAVEQANNDAQRVNLDTLQFAEDGSITPEAVRQFVRAMPQAEQGGLIDTNGQPTKQAVDRINAAVFARAYGNDQLIRLFAQAQDPEARNVLSALAQVAPKMARLDGLGALDIRDVVTQAAEIAVNARREGKAIARAAQQLDMAADPMVGVVLDLFAANPRSVKPVVEALSNAADLAYTEATKPAEDMFGAVPRASRTDVINQLRPQDERASQENLEQPARREPVQVDAGRAEAQPAAAANPAATEGGRPAETEGLTSYTPQEIEDRLAKLEQAERERQQQEREAEQRQQADAERDTFTLTGSDRAADVAAAQGQTDIFSAPAEPGIDTAKLEKDFRTYPTKILSVLIERGELPKLHKAAGVKSANAFGDMPIDDQAAAYVKFVVQGGKPVDGLPADYNAWVASQEREIEVRRLQSDRVVRQANGKPFKTEAGAKQMQERFDLQGTHEIVAVDGGFELRQLSPSAQAEIQRKAEGRESYTDAQAAVAAEMGIGQTADGEWDATDEQFDEMERRTQARMRGESAQPAAPTYTYTQPSKIDTPTQGVLAGAKERKARAFARLKSVRQQVKDGTATRLDLLKAEDAHKEAIRAVEDAQEQLERDANRQGLTTVREAAPAYGDQTQTEAFKRWFGDSKVVDAEGKPLVVYHGTASDFSAFNKSKSGANWRQGEGAFFFTSRQRTAGNYAMRGGEGANVMPVYLSITNPLMRTALDPIDHYDISIKPEREALEAQGYDGVIVKSADGGGDLYVAFHPEQIKSAIGNNGNFDPNDPSIVREGGADYNASAPRRPYTDDRQLQLFLDNGPVESQAGPRGEAAQRAAVAAVDDLRSTETILGLALSRDYAARQRVSLVGQKVSSAEDLAVLAQVYRDPRFETFRVVFVNDSGKVVSQVGLTSRLPAAAPGIMGSDLDAYLGPLMATARNRGASGYYMLHNHPSGSAKTSRADEVLTNAYADRTFGTDMQFRGHVVIDTNEYSVINGRGESSLFKKDFGQPAPYQAQEWADVKIGGPADVMAMAKRLQVDADAVTLIHTDSQFNVKAISTIPTEATIGDTKEVHKLIVKASLKAQGSQVFAVSRNVAAMVRIKGAIRDGIYVSESGQVRSLASEGLVGGSSPFPENRRTRVSPDTSPEFAYLRAKPQAEQQQQRAAEEGAEYSPELQNQNRDALGRVKFRLGEVALGKLDAATRPLQERFGMRMASPELRRQLRQMKATIEEAKRKAVDVAKEMNAMPEADRAMVSDIVEKMIAPGVVPPEHAVKVADAITRTMDQQTDELVALGMLSPESAVRWRGRYLPRIYNRQTELQDDPLIKRLFKTGTPTMQGIGGGSLKGRGLFQDVSIDSVDQWLAMGYEVRDPHWKMNQGKLELVDKNAPQVARDQVTVWRDWTPSERAQMGENRDALYRFVQGYTAMQRDIALGRLFNNIANNPEWVRRSGADGWVQVPNTEIPDTGGVKRYGNLAGLWVRKDVMSHLTQFEEAANDTLQLYREALGLWKEGKTALNPVAHFNNVMSNVSMAHFAGVSFWDGHKYAAAVRDLVNDAPMVDEARKVGLFTGSFTKEEMVQAMPPELQKLMDMKEGKARKAGKQVMNAMTFWLRKPLRNAYEFEDSFFKYLIYRDARQQGMSPEAATDYALRYIFTYDDLPSGARKVRDFAIPFFSWTYKAAPALLHTAMVYPWRFLAPAAVLNGINLVAYALAAGDEDDNWLEKIAKGRELEKEEREALPERTAGTGLLLNPKTIRLGTDSVTGNPVFLDASRVVPGGDMFDMVNQAGGIALPAPLMPNHPVLTAFSAMIANKEMFFGREIVDKNDTGLEAAEKRAKWMAGFMLPAVAPGGYHSQRIADAAANAMDTVITVPGLGEFTGVDRSGQPVQPKYAAMQTLGIKARPTDLELEAQRKRAQEAALINSIAAEVRSMARLYQRGAVSDEMMERTREKAREKIERVREGEKP